MFLEWNNESIVKIWKENPDLLYPVEKDIDFEKYRRAIGLAFDVDPKIVDHVYNRDYISNNYLVKKTFNELNYIQY